MKYLLSIGALCVMGASFYSGYIIGSNKTKLVDVVPKIETHYEADPTIKAVLVASDYDATRKSYHRLLERNTEYDTCLTLDEVTVDSELKPSVLHSERLCSLKINGTPRSLLSDSLSDIEYFNLKYDTHFTFDVSLEGQSQLHCRIEDPKNPIVTCSGSKE